MRRRWETSGWETSRWAGALIGLSAFVAGCDAGETDTTTPAAEVASASAAMTPRRAGDEPERSVPLAGGPAPDRQRPVRASAPMPTGPTEPTGPEEPTEPAAPAATPPSPLDQQLRAIIARRGLTGDASRGRELPTIEDPLAQLGLRLFFSTSLSGGFDVACASCHHPALGGGDGLSLPIGVGAVDPMVLGPARTASFGAPRVGRNAQSFINAGLWDSGLFFDSRVESLGKEPLRNGAASGIRTPDSALGVADPEAGDDLPAAQSLFPLVSRPEMLGDAYLAGRSGDAIRAHLAARLGGYGAAAGELANGSSGWVAAFREVYGDDETPAELITAERIADAIGAYERAVSLTSNPWRRYVEGDDAALGDEAKRGALAFLLPEAEGGRNCARCHSGDRFSDERHHTVGFPQIGPGMGDGPTGDDDVGRARETGQQRDRWAFRTPSLLNVARTAPYGHAGTYTSLEQVMQHYANPQARASGYVMNAEWCRQPQYAALPDCVGLYPNAVANTARALQKVAAERDSGTSLLPRQPIPPEVAADIIAFLRALTDPCLDDASCRARLVPPDDGGPDGEQLRASIPPPPPAPAPPADMPPAGPPPANMPPAGPPPANPPPPRPPG